MMTAPAAGNFNAEEHECRGHLLSIEGKILRPGLRLDFDDVLLAYEIDGGLAHEVGEVGIIDGGRITHLVSNRVVTAEHLNYLKSPFDLAHELLSDLLAETANRSLEMHFLGDDITPGAGAVKGTDRQNRRLERRDAPRDYLLRRLHKLGCDHDRVDRRLGVGAVPTFAFDGYGE